MSSNRELLCCIWQQSNCVFRNWQVLLAMSVFSLIGAYFPHNFLDASVLTQKLLQVCIMNVISFPALCRYA